MTLESFIAEIETDLQVFADSGDIDRISIKSWVIDCLREFGVNISDVVEEILPVENSSALLPDYFKALKLALLLDPIGCDKKIDVERSPYIYKQYIKNPAYFDEITQEYITACNPEIITEQIFIENSPATIYHRYKWLSIAKGFKRNNIASDCLNLSPRVRDNYSDKINITGNTLNTNFSKGLVYVQMYTLPTENGEVAIPEITTGAIYKYIKVYVKANIAENLIANNKNPLGLIQLYPVWKQEAFNLRPSALREAKFSGLSKDWNKKYKLQTQLDFAKYTLPQLKF